MDFTDHDTGENTGVDGFNITLPYSENIARVVLLKGDQEIGVRERSVNKPFVDVISPNGGEIWGKDGFYTISWTAGDLDGDNLTYGVLYSPNGVNWLPLGLGITETQMTVDSSELPGGDQAKIWVFATDGLNTISDQSDLSFIVKRKAPEVSILSPVEGDVIRPYSNLILQGYAYDREDGALEDSSFSWISGKDGGLGSGKLLLVNLSPGYHAITLSVTDSDGNTTSDTIHIFVGNRIFLPLTMK
jgi:hypothetical protein